MAGDLGRQCEWESHGYQDCAVFSVCFSAGAGSPGWGGPGGGSAFIKPGKRKLAGEILCDALMPLQPTTSSEAASIANRRNLPFNITTNASIVFTIVFATYYSDPNSAFHWSCEHRKTVAVSVVVICAFIQPLLAADNGVADQQAFTGLAEKAYLAAGKRFQADPTNSTVAWMFGRACFNRADFATNDTQRATLAVEGINTMRMLVAREPDLAAAHYYLGMNLGQLARTKTLGALKLVGEMEEEFKTARKLNENFSHAGPDRNLGLLYLKAPGWPASIGNRSKARRHLERAVQLAPEYPENRLNLVEAFIKWGNRKGAQRELESVQALLPAARTNFAGEAWLSSWSEWEDRMRWAQGQFRVPK
jgi:tetratricopeptide (TPR) repeat protein